MTTARDLTVTLSPAERPFTPPDSPPPSRPPSAVRLGFAYEIGPAEKNFGQAEINYKVDTYNRVGRRYSNTLGDSTPASIIHGDKFGAVTQVVGIDPNNSDRVIIAWQEAPGLIVWKSVPKASVPQPVYLYEWDPKTNKANRVAPSATGWAAATYTTVDVDVGGVIVTLGVGAVGALAGVAAGSTNAMPPRFSPIGGN